MLRERPQPIDGGHVLATRSQPWSANSGARSVALVYFDSSAVVKLVAEENGSDPAAPCGAAEMQPSRAASRIPRCAEHLQRPGATTVSTRPTSSRQNGRGTTTGPRFDLSS